MPRAEYIDQEKDSKYKPGSSSSPTYPTLPGFLLDTSSIVPSSVSTKRSREINDHRRGRMNWVETRVNWDKAACFSWMNQAPCRLADAMGAYSPRCAGVAMFDRSRWSRACVHPLQAALTHKRDLHNIYIYIYFLLYITFHKHPFAQRFNVVLCDRKLIAHLLKYKLSSYFAPNPEYAISSAECSFNFLSIIPDDSEWFNDFNRTWCEAREGKIYSILF